MEQGSNQEPRYTFSIIHDDEFRPMREESFEKAKMKTDSDDWKDTWQKQPEVFRNQIRAVPSQHNKYGNDVNMHGPYD